MFVAVLPQAALNNAGGDPNAVLERMRNSTGRAGTYAVVIGNSNSAFGLQARSTLGSVGDLAAAAYSNNRENPAGALVELANEVGARADAGGFADRGGCWQYRRRRAFRGRSAGLRGCCWRRCCRLDRLLETQSAETQ